MVVDFRQLGGGSQPAAYADGGGDAADALFADAGFALTYVQRFTRLRVPGRRRAGRATRCVNTPPANAYWGAVVVRRQERHLDLLQRGRRLA